MPSSLQVSPAQPTGGRRRRTADDDPDERRQRFLERNRAAASRCRQKRKLWVSSLEKKAEELSTLNVSLSVSGLGVGERDQCSVSFTSHELPPSYTSFRNVSR